MLPLRPVIASWPLVPLAAASLQAATFNLGVSLSDSIRPVTHCAAGSLYGITETLPSDIPGLVAPLNAYSYRNPAMSGASNQHPFGDAIKVSERLAKTTSQVQFDLADILAGWPYNWVSTADYQAKVTTVINNKIASGRNNYEGYEIWNEPDGTWKSGSGDINTVCWKPIFDLIRSKDPKAKIIGPSYSYYNNSRMQSFLTWTKANNCLPDIVSWHQWGSEGFVGAYESYRALEKSLGISPREISINEYSSNTHTLEGCPGVSVPFIAKFERYKIQSAHISWWFVPLPGRLGSLLTSSNAKGGGWHLYKWYGDMTGYMTKTTPPNDKSDGVDAFAAVDASKQYASIILGGNSVGTVNVNISGVPAWMGSSVNVKLESVTWTDKDTPVSGTTVVSTTKLDVANGSLSVPVNITNAYNAYRLYLTPTASGVSVTHNSRTKSDTYRVLDLYGRTKGHLTPTPEEALDQALARTQPKPGVYLLAPENGTPRKVIVPSP